MHAFALALELPEHHFDRWLTGPMATLGPLHYPPHEGRISESQASKVSMSRAFCRGSPPITPALQASRTSAGPVTRNIGAQIAGMVRPDRIFGSKLLRSALQIGFW